MNYHDAKPFPHEVIDGFLPQWLADEAADQFPGSDWPLWKRFIADGKASKYEMADRHRMPEALHNIVTLINASCRDVIGKRTGFDDLFSDPALYGGGLNLVEPGGFLAPHSDFNWNDRLRAYRTINLLVYFNPGWAEGDGGELELWGGDEVARRIAPIHNRAVIFTTTDNAIHGYGPVSKQRRSANFYFYRKDAAPGIATAPHRTLWKEIA